MSLPLTPPLLKGQLYLDASSLYSLEILAWFWNYFFLKYLPEIMGNITLLCSFICWKIFKYRFNFLKIASYSGFLFSLVWVLMLHNSSNMIKSKFFTFVDIKFYLFNFSSIYSILPFFIWDWIFLSSLIFLDLS